MLVNNSSSSSRIQNSLATASTSRTKSLERLATALRINRASDDAAGLSVSEGLRSQIRGDQMAQRNASDGYAMLQIAEGGASQVTDSLQRMRELALQSQNGTYNTTDRAAMQKEYDQLRQEITRTADSTTYNGQKLLTGGPAVSFQVAGQGGAAGTISAASSTNLASDLGLGDISTAQGASAALKAIDQTMGSVSSMRSDFGAASNRLEATISNLGTATANLTDADSRIRDTDYAAEVSKLLTSTILQQSSTAMMAQANSMSEGVLGLLHAGNS